MPVTDRQNARIERIFDDRLRDDRLDMERRRERVLRELPRIGQIDDRIRELAVERTGRLLWLDVECEDGPRESRSPEPSAPAPRIPELRLADRPE